jgi:hypothetical protein
MKLALLLLAATFAHAQRVPVLAELFTSEGCSSCPPADQLLQQLDRQQPVAGAQVIVLSEHVDYWDHLGWRDAFSSPQFTQRQEAYGRKLGAEVYTPQLVIDGHEAVLGNDPAIVAKTIARAAAHTKLPVAIKAVRREGGEAIVTVSIAALPKGRGEVWVAIADEADRSSVLHGENSGHTLTHVAVVRSLTKAGAASKSEGFEKVLRLPAQAGPSRVVVFLCDTGGQVTGAAEAPLP